jgi:predicted dehydrogenase
VKLDGDRLAAIDLRHPVAGDVVAAGHAVSVAASSPVVSDVSAHRAVFEDFIAAIGRGVPPMCDGVQGRASVAVIEAIYRSSATGQPVGL